MNRRFGLFSALTLLVLSMTLTACLGGLPQQSAPPSPKAAVPAQPAVVTPTLAVTATKALTPTIAASKATTVTTAAVVSATVGVTTTARVTATASVTATAKITATPAISAKSSTPVTGTLSPKLQDATWTLESYGKPDKQVKVLAQAPITASFGTDNKVAGSAGCNNYNGTYVVSGNELSVGPLATTRKMCAQPIMQQEQAYLDALQAARTYEIASDGKLKISYTEGNVLIFGPQAAMAGQPVGTPITPTVGVTTTRPVTATKAITATPQITPQNETNVIRFDPGATTTQVSGQVKPGGSVLYTLNAKAGQKLTVSISANGPMRVAISDPKGQLIGVAEAAAPWAGSLPLTGEYRLTVQAPMDVAMVSYTLDITLN